MSLRAPLVALLVLAASACFSPSPPEGLACAAGDTCPPGQTCQSGVCLSGAPGDAGPGGDLGPFACDEHTLGLFSFDDPENLGRESCGSTQLALVVVGAEPTPDSPAPDFELAARLPNNGAGVDAVGLPADLQNLTVELWLEVSGDTPPGGGRVVTIAGPDGAVPMLAADLRLGGLTVALPGCAQEAAIELVRDAFTHLRLVVGPAGVAIAVDGEPAAQIDSPGDCTVAGPSLSVGAPDGAISGFLGKLDELRISDVGR